MEEHGVLTLHHTHTDTDTDTDTHNALACWESHELAFRRREGPSQTVQQLSRRKGLVKVVPQARVVTFWSQHRPQKPRNHGARGERDIDGKRGTSLPLSPTQAGTCMCIRNRRSYKKQKNQKKQNTKTKNKNMHARGGNATPPGTCIREQSQQALQEQGATVASGQPTARQSDEGRRGQERPRRAHVHGQCQRHQAHALAEMWVAQHHICWVGKHTDVDATDTTQPSRHTCHTSTPTHIVRRSDCIRLAWTHKYTKHTHAQQQQQQQQQQQ